MDDYSKPPGASASLLGLIESLGWPLTKASYVRAMFFPLMPDLPLDADVEAQVPEDLPGEIPTSPRDLSFRMSDRARATPERQLPEPLIERTMKAHGFSRAEAIEELKKFGA